VSLRRADARCDADDLMRPIHAKNGPPMKNVLPGIALLLALAACDRTSDLLVCPPYVGNSVVVTVQDSVTGANVTPGASVVASNAAYSDSVVAPPTATAVYAGYGSGTFTVTVRQSGYLTWTKTGVKVEDDGCAPLTVPLTARLRPAA
jgi:hypothetical protein